MRNQLHQLEDHTGLTANQCAKLIGCPRPTYYQYRRTSDMPDVVRRIATVLTRLSVRQLNSLIEEFVHGNTL